MDDKKFEGRVLEGVKEGLKFQKLQKITPTKLIEHRDRWFLVSCKNGDNKSKQFLFLRFEKWFLLIDGLFKLPPVYDKREYTDNVRTIQNRESIIEQPKETNA